MSMHLLAIITGLRAELADLNTRIAALEHPASDRAQSMASILGDVDPNTPAYDRSAAMKAFWSKRKAAKTENA